MEENNEEKGKLAEGVEKGAKGIGKFLLKKFKKWIIIGVLGLFSLLLVVGLLHLVEYTVKDIFNKIINSFNIGSVADGAETTSNNDSVIYIDENGHYKLKANYSEEILKELEEQKVNNNVMGFNLEDGEDEAVFRDMIDKYIKAEVGTTFPNTGRGFFTALLNLNDVEGNITVKRNNQTEPLDYVKYSSFKARVNNQDTSILNCFSINPDNFKLCIAKKNTVTQYYKNGSVVSTQGGGITIEELDYQTLMENYSVPLNFLLTMHLISQDVDFMNELVDLATGAGKTDPLVLTYIDSQETYTTEYIYSGYQNEVIESIKTPEDHDPNRESELITEEEIEGKEEGDTWDYNEINNGNAGYYYDGVPGYDKQVTTSYAGKLYITKADTWLKTSEKTISSLSTPTTQTGSVETPIYYTRNYTYPVTSDKDSLTPPITKIMETIYTVDMKETVSSSTNSQKYTVSDAGNAIVVEKFIELIEKYPSVKNNLTTAPSNVFYLLQQNENTQKLEKIMRYVLYVLNDIDYGVTESELQYLLEDNMFSVSGLQGGLQGGNIEEKLWFTLISMGYSKESTAGVMGNLHCESAGLVANRLEFIYAKGGSKEIPPGYTDETYTAAVDNGTYTADEFINDAAGYGLAQWTWYTRKEGLYRFAESQGKSIGDEDIQIEYLLGELGHSEYASGYAHKIIGNSGYSEDWLNATTPEEAAEAFCWAYENPIAYSQDRSTMARHYYDKYKDAAAGGIFQQNTSDPRVAGTFTSSITGRTFTIFNQMQIYTDYDHDGQAEQWNDRCNRCTQISICSGYGNKSVDEWINAADAAPNGIMPAYGPLYTSCGLTCVQQSTGATFEHQRIKEQIQSGGYIAIYLKGNNVGHPGTSKYRKKMGKLYALGCNFRI